MHIALITNASEARTQGSIARRWPDSYLFCRQVYEVDKTDGQISIFTYSSFRL